MTPLTVTRNTILCLWRPHCTPIYSLRRATRPGINVSKVHTEQQQLLADDTSCLPEEVRTCLRTVMLLVTVVVDVSMRQEWKKKDMRVRKGEKGDRQYSSTRILWWRWGRDDDDGNTLPKKKRRCQFVDTSLEWSGVTRSVRGSSYKTCRVVSFRVLLPAHKEYYIANTRMYGVECGGVSTGTVRVVPACWRGGREKAETQHRHYTVLLYVKVRTY